MKRRRASKRGTIDARLRRAATLATAIVTITSIAGYVALSFTINGLPTYPPGGWVAVLQPVTVPDLDTVQLLVAAQSQGGQTRASYEVIVCGPRPYSGDLLIGGSAQLITSRSYPPLPRVQAPQIQRIPDLAFLYNGVINLGPAEMVRISLPVVPACPPASSAPSTEALLGGSAEGVIGTTSGPFQQSWSGPWGLWHGPHASQAWPLAGIFPGIPANVLGEYPAIAGLRGSWSRPLQEYVKVTADAVPVTWSVDSAVPSASGPYPLTWQDRNPLSPVVRLTDSSSLALLQNWVVLFAVAFGIAGSVLASLLFEWLRRPAPSGTASDDKSASRPLAVHSSRPMHHARDPGGWLALAGAVILIGYARRRRARAKHR